MADIYNYESDTLISGTSKADYIYNGDYSNVTIKAGKGKDTVYSYGSQVSINAGAGNDEINLYGTGHLIQYASGDGNDTIYGFNEIGHADNYGRLLLHDKKRQ